MPGLVELHTDNLEKHFAPRPGVQWPILAAVMAHDAQIAVGRHHHGARQPGRRLPHRRRAATARPASARGRGAGGAGGQCASVCRHYLHLRCEVGTESVLRTSSRSSTIPPAARVAHGPRARAAAVRESRQVPRVQPGQVRRCPTARWTRSSSSAWPTTPGTVRSTGPPIVALCQKHGLRLASHDDATAAHVEEAAQVGTVIAEFPTTLEAADAARA